MGLIERVKEWSGFGAKPDNPVEAALEEMHQRWTYGTDEWREIREEGKTDVKYVAGDPWDAQDRKAREADGRPCLSLDELGQYVNELINDIRQHKRAIKATPIGNGATDASAELTQNTIRQIEYRSNAQQAYTTMFENAVQRSYGFLRVKPRYTNRARNEQELMIEPIINPDMVTMDPDAQKTDGSDMGWLFYSESITRKEFKRKYPRAKVVDFTAADEKSSNGWITPQRVRVAEYWTAEPNARGDIEVIQRFTNGLEFLPNEEGKLETKWPGKCIPFVSDLGKVLYVDDGGEGTRRRILSLIRLARDPYMYYCYIRTCQAETVGMTPKTPLVGYVGQFRTRTEDWGKVNHKPMGYIEVDAMTEATGANILPIPQPIQRNSDLQALELLAEGARRAIQSAVGETALPSSAQRRNEKSKIALEYIKETGQIGSYHFVDHFEDAITRTGVILADLLPHYYDTPRDLTVRKPDGTPDVVKINQPGAIDPKTGQPGPPLTFAGDHDITLGTGPNFASERDAANQFSDTFVQVLPNIAPLIGPQKSAKLLALSVRLKDLGPIGDEIVNTIDPEAEQANAEQLQQKVAESGKMIEALTAHVNELTKQIETDQVKAQAAKETAELKAKADLAMADLQMKADLAAKELDLQSKERIAALQAKVEMDKLQATIAADQAAAQLASDQARAVEMMKLDAEAENEAKRMGHEAEEKAKDRQLASATKKTKTVSTQRDDKGHLTANVVEESTVAD